MSEEIQLRGHGGAFRLWAVPTDDGRTLLASSHKGGAVRVWDPWTGERVAGPLRLHEGTVNDLAVARLGPDGARVLVSCDDSCVKLWHPSTLAEAGSLPRRIGRRGARRLAVLPATASMPELIVTTGQRGIRVTDPASGRTHFKRSQSRRHPKGAYALLAALRLDGGTPGLALLRRGRFGVEVWAAARGKWQRRHNPSFMLPAGPLVFLPGEGGEPLLAVADGRKVAVWDLDTGRPKARGDLDTRITALAAVPLRERTLLAVSGQDRGAGVRLWDPATGRTIGEMFNGHGPSTTSAMVVVGTLAVITGPAGSGMVRVASEANDGLIRISPPFSGPGDTPPERLPDLGPAEEREARSGFAFVRNRSEEVVGFWFADAESAENRVLIDALLVREGLQRWIGRRYRVMPNTVDDKGGAFVLFGDS